MSADELALADAEAALAQGRETATALGVSVSLAIVDDSGVLKAFTRMDGAEIAGEVLAVDKAYTAVSNRLSTAELGRLAQPGGELFGLQANGRGRYVVIGGGVPITVGGRVIGAVGVSGAAAHEDVQCAESVLRAIQSRLT